MRQPNWLRDAIDYAYTIATPPRRTRWPGGGILVWDCTGNHVCAGNFLPPRIPPGRLMPLAHAHNSDHDRSYGLICVFAPEVLRPVPTSTLLHELAHFTATGDHTMNWMKRYRLLMEYFDFDLEARRLQIGGFPWIQTAEEWGNAIPKIAVETA